MWIIVPEQVTRFVSFAWMLKRRMECSTYTEDGENPPDIHDALLVARWPNTRGSAVDRGLHTRPLLLPSVYSACPRPSPASLPCTQLCVWHLATFALTMTSQRQVRTQQFPRPSSHRIPSLPPVSRGRCCRSASLAASRAELASVAPRVPLDEGLRRGRGRTRPPRRPAAEQQPHAATRSHRERDRRNHNRHHDLARERTSDRSARKSSPLHLRDEQMRRELALVPAQHKEVPARLSVAERGLYDPAARAVSDLAQRWARQGLFGHHAGRAQQWLQNLQRLAFHPALQLRESDTARAAQAANQRPPPRAAQAATLADLIVRRVVLEVVADAAAADLATEEELQKALLSSFITMSAPEAVTWAGSEALRLRMGLPAAAGVRGQRAPAASSGNKPHQVFPQETMEMLKKIAEIPPELPTCGVCMDIMAEPTVMTCYHLFCKQCIIDIVDSSRNTMTRNIHAKCPYCRDANAMINEKRVVQPQFHAEGASQAQLDLEDAVAEVTNPAADAEAEVNSGPVGTPDEQLAAQLSTVGAGTRVEALLQLLEGQVWSGAQPQSDDGVLIFSKFPAALERVRQALTERGYKPHLITGGVTLAQRRKIIAGLCHMRTEGDASSTATASAERGQTARGDRRILLLTSRAANAGLNLTFANHVVFMEPNVNPALEIQAIGRAHRFGQTKQVYAYHLYAPDTVEDRIYTQSRQLLAAAERERPQPQEQREGHLHNAPIGAINQMRSQDLLNLLTIPGQ